MDYWLEILTQKKICTKIIINTHHLSESVEKFVQSHQSSELIELIHEEQLLGTAGTIKKILPKIKNEELFVAHADNLTLFDLEQFLECHKHRPTGCIATMMTFETDDPSSCGIVQRDENGIVKSFYEKVSNPPGALANAAVYIFSNKGLDIIDRVSLKRDLDISNDILPLMIGRIYTYHNSIYHRDIGRRQSLLFAENEFPKIYQKYMKGEKIE